MSFISDLFDNLKNADFKVKKRSDISNKTISNLLNKHKNLADNIVVDELARQLDGYFTKNKYAYDVDRALEIFRDFVVNRLKPNRTERQKINWILKQVGAWGVDKVFSFIQDAVFTILTGGIRRPTTGLGKTSRDYTKYDRALREKEKELKQKQKEFNDIKQMRDQDDMRNFKSNPSQFRSFDDGTSGTNYRDDINKRF